jgi:glyoxylase-like metal-dependent hydrolase (beta-lactamase superfamily II)
MRLLLKTLGFLFLVALVLAAAVLGWGHVQIRRVSPELPSLDEVLTADRTAELPVRLSWINTASQRMPRSSVLDAALDPHPDADYTMSHPSFVVEWQDGRIFLIDLGLNAAAAIGFGVPAEILAGADPIQPHEATSARLGESRTRVAGIGFTHLHSDHTSGLLDLCRDLGALGLARDPIPVFQHHWQLALVNHTTRAGRSQLAKAGCVESHSLGFDAGLLPIPDFPGLFAIPAGGHTPGSTIYVVQLRTIPGESSGRYDDVQTWVVAGDLVNHYEGIEKGIPKPPLYSMLVVPEDDERLAELRGFLRELAKEPGVQLLVSHDRNQIQSTRLPRY